MVSREIKINPDDVRLWNLSDLVNMVSDILNKLDIETYAYYFPES